MQFIFPRYLILPIEPVEILFSLVLRIGTSFVSIDNLMQQQIFKASDIKSYL